MRLLRAEDDTLIGKPVLQSADRAVDRVRNLLQLKLGRAQRYGLAVSPALRARRNPSRCCAARVMQSATALPGVNASAGNHVVKPSVTDESLARSPLFFAQQGQAPAHQNNFTPTAA